MSTTIRLIQPEDVQELVRIEADSFTCPWVEADFLDLLTRSYCLYLVALNGDEIVGCAGLTKLDNEGDIHKVVVKKEYRGRGIASSLMDALLTEGRKRGVEEFTLEVRVSNASAIALYEKFGFQSEGIRPRFYEKPVEDAMIMWLRQ